MKGFSILFMVLFFSSAKSLDLYETHEISNFFSEGQFLAEIDYSGCLAYEAELTVFCNEASRIINEAIKDIRVSYRRGGLIGKILIPKVDLERDIDFRYGHIKLLADSDFDIFPGGLRVSDISDLYFFPVTIETNNVSGDGTLRVHNYDFLGLGKDLDFDVDIRANKAQVRLIVSLSFNPRLFRRPDGKFFLTVEPVSRVFPDIASYDDLNISVDHSLENLLFSAVNSHIQTKSLIDLAGFGEPGWLDEFISDGTILNPKDVFDIRMFFSYLFTSQKLLCGTRSCFDNLLDFTVLREKVWDRNLKPFAFSFFVLDPIFRSALSELVERNTNHEWNRARKRSFVGLEDNINQELLGLLGGSAYGVVKIDLPDLDEFWTRRVAAALTLM